MAVSDTGTDTCASDAPPSGFHHAFAGTDIDKWDEEYDDLCWPWSRFRRFTENHRFGTVSFFAVLAAFTFRLTANSGRVGGPIGPWMRNGIWDSRPDMPQDSRTSSTSPLLARLGTCHRDRTLLPCMLWTGLYGAMWSSGRRGRSASRNRTTDVCSWGCCRRTEQRAISVQTALSMRACAHRRPGV